jgi:hypothetical protein
VLFQFHELYLPPRRSIKEKVIKMVTVREKESKKKINDINKNYLCSREEDKNERNKSNRFILFMSSNQPLEILVHQ